MTDLSNTPRIRSALADDVARIGAIAHAAYSHRVVEKGFSRVYMRRSLRGA